MANILILGAGKSSVFLIDYLVKSAGKRGDRLFLADVSLDAAREKLGNQPHTLAVELNIHNERSREEMIKQADVVVSMLPPGLHPLIARDCIKYGKNFFSASYQSKEMKEMEGDIRAQNLFFLNECGLDPGLDHMSAMSIIDREKEKNNEILLFKSFCGGLLVPESNSNPWQYKFTWNPRNVVLAGQGVAGFVRNGYYKFIPYHMLFRRIEKLDFPELGIFEAYPNRDSLSYRSIYGLENIPTILRGTIRRVGFCKSWDVFVQLGMTDDSYQLDLPKGFTMRMFTDTFLPYNPGMRVEEKILSLLPFVDKATLEKIAWTGLFTDQPLQIRKGSPAAILQNILEEKWQMDPADKDLVLMQHLIEVREEEVVKQISSSLIVKGERQPRTAMAKTVGLPLAMAVEMFLEGRFRSRGLLLPTIREIYQPLLQKLQNEGIAFKESISVKQESNTV